MAAGHTLLGLLKLLVFLLSTESIVRQNTYIRSDDYQRPLQAAVLPFMLRISTEISYLKSFKSGTAYC